VGDTMNIMFEYPSRNWLRKWF